MKDIKKYYLLLYKIACEQWEKKWVLYRNRAYIWAFLNWKCYILNSKNELLNITNKKFIIF